MPTQTFVKNRKQELRKIGDRRDVIEERKVRFVNTVLGKKTSNDKIAFSSKKTIPFLPFINPKCTRLTYAYKVNTGVI